jgi:hypothetical protein
VWIRLPGRGGVRQHGQAEGADIEEMATNGD